MDSNLPFSLQTFEPVGESWHVSVVRLTVVPGLVPLGIAPEVGSLMVLEELHCSDGAAGVPGGP